MDEILLMATIDDNSITIKKQSEILKSINNKLDKISGQLAELIEYLKAMKEL